MKRFIRYITASHEVDIDTSMFKGSPFIPKTGMSYYDNFLNQEDLAYMRKAKNRNGEIVMMSPKEYFEQCSKYVFRHHPNATVEALKKQRRRDAETIAWMEDQLLAGKKFNLCFINYADAGQEGLHRMLTLGELYGWDKKYPVLAVTVDDEAWEAEIQLRREESDFERYDFSEICKAAADEISDWKSPPPDNLPELLRNEIIKQASNFEHEDEYGYDIDVEIEETIEDDRKQLLIFLTRYKTYELPVLSNPVILWVEDYFDTGDHSSYEIDDSSLDDLDISDLLFL